MLGSVDIFRKQFQVACDMLKYENPLMKIPPPGISAVRGRWDFPEYFKEYFKKSREDEFLTLLAS